MNIKAFKIIVTSFILFLFGANFAGAGFGVSPPYVMSDKLTPGSNYEQEISIIRGNKEVEGEQMAEIVIDAPEIKDWISIDKGNSFLLPKGEKQVRMKIRIDVPKNAKFGEYKGKIHLTAQPRGDLKQGAVSIVLGMQINIDLKVVDLEIYDYKVLGMKVLDLEEGHKFLWWYIPGKIKVALNIENIGNKKIAPSRVHLDIYDTSKTNLLESLDNYNKIKKILPFKTKEVIAKFKTDLEPGSYSAYFKIYKNDEIVKEGETTLSILSQGTLQAEKKGIFFWPGLIGIIFIAFAAGGLLMWLKKIKRNKRR